MVCCWCLIPTLGLKGVGVAVLISTAASRTYKNVVGLRLYGSGVSEHKMWILMGICTAIAFASLFFTGLIADVIMFAVLMAAMALVLNKELLTVIATAKSLMFSKKSSSEK